MTMRPEDLHHLLDDTLAGEPSTSPSVLDDLDRGRRALRRRNRGVVAGAVAGIALVAGGIAYAPTLIGAEPGFAGGGDSVACGEATPLPTPDYTPGKSSDVPDPVPAGEECTPSPDPDVTPAPTPPDVTPAPTPPDVTPAPTPPDVTPAPTPPDVTPAPTPPDVTPAPTGSDLPDPTPSGLPDPTPSG